MSKNENTNSRIARIAGQVTIGGSLVLSLAGLGYGLAYFWGGVVNVGCFLLNIRFASKMLTLPVDQARGTARLNYMRRYLIYAGSGVVVGVFFPQFLWATLLAYMNVRIAVTIYSLGIVDPSYVVE